MEIRKLDSAAFQLLCHLLKHGWSCNRPEDAVLQNNCGATSNKPGKN